MPGTSPASSPGMRPLPAPAVAICLNRQEKAPSAVSSAEGGVALSLLCRLRDFGRVGNSSDVLRRVFEYVGQNAE